jgi:hypoxanthine phosphoribosyltransferase
MSWQIGDRQSAVAGPERIAFPFAAGLCSISPFSEPSPLSRIRAEPMKILIPADQIQQRVADLAQQIARDFRDRPLTIVAVLTGSLIFLADLVRHLNLQLRIGLIQASSYRGETTTPGELTIGPELLPEVRGRHVLLLDDILDTGKTLSRLVDHLKSLEVASLRTAVLLRKQGRQQVSIEPDYTGFEIPDAFVVGYGLDYNDEYRHLPYLAVLKDEVHRQND